MAKRPPRKRVPERQEGWDDELARLEAALITFVRRQLDPAKQKAILGNLYNDPKKLPAHGGRRGRPLARSRWRS